MIGHFVTTSAMVGLTRLFHVAIGDKMQLFGTRRRFLAKFLSLAVSLSVGSVASAQITSSACFDLFAPARILITEPTVAPLAISPVTPKRDWSQITTLRVMSYNVENLFWHVGKYVRDVDGTMKPSFQDQKGPKFKPEEKIDAIRALIEEEAPDIIELQEVEGSEALMHLAEKRLNGKYQGFIVKGNDDRGINVGVLVRSDLPLFAEYLTNKDVTYQDPKRATGDIKLFSRDLPALVLRRSPQAEPFMVIVGNHAKSMRDRPGDPQSVRLRTAQYKKAAEIIEGYAKTYPQARIILAGDFNTDTRSASDLDPIRAIMPSGFEITGVPVDQQITYTYHPYGAPTVYNRLDDIRIYQRDRAAIKAMRVVPYKDANGNPQPPSATYKERQKQPSDHRPVVADILVH